MTEPEPWGEDPKLDALLGEQGAARLSRGVRRLPGRRSACCGRCATTTGAIVDFEFGYGNPSIMRLFRLPAATRDRYTLLEALPADARQTARFDAYVTRVRDRPSR